MKSTLDSRSGAIFYTVHWSRDHKSEIIDLRQQVNNLEKRLSFLAGKFFSGLKKKGGNELRSSFPPFFSGKASFIFISFSIYTTTKHDKQHIQYNQLSPHSVTSTSSLTNTYLVLSSLSII